MEDKCVVKFPAFSGEVTPVINKRGRKSSGRKQLFQCDECLYTSDRNFNVERHRIRIHCKQIDKRCCGKKFLTKADWYYHVEDFHPNMRENSYVSKEKYQILGSKSRQRHQKYSCSFYASRTRTRVHKIISSSSSSSRKRSSLRVKNKLERKCLLMVRQLNETGSLGYDLDELPLYYRLKYPELSSSSSYQSQENYQLAPEETQHQIELNLPGDIDFSSDFTDNFTANSIQFMSNYSDKNITGDKSFDYSDDSGFNEIFTVPEVDHEEIIEQVVEEQAQEIIREDNIDDNYFCQFTRKVNQKCESNIVVSKRGTDGGNLGVLPPKKRLLKQWETNVISSTVRQRKPKIKTSKRIMGANYENEENINPNKDKGFKIVVRQEKMSIWQQNHTDKENNECKVVVMEEKSREIYWNAQERHRAFLDYFDFDRFKIL